MFYHKPILYSVIFTDMNFRYPILLLAFFLCTRTVFAQVDSIPLTTVIEKTSELAKIRPTEKVYLHLDKPYYAVGDTLWFKAYLTSEFNVPSQFSRVIYVDLINSRDSLAGSLMLKAINGTAQGSIPLTGAKFKQDNYRIRAYTRWMMNFDSGLFFNRTLAIGSAATTPLKTLVAFKRTTNNAATQVTTTISFKDGSDTPYANKKFTWTITTGMFSELGRGKGTTDASGLATIPYTPQPAQDLKNARLNVTLDAGKDKEYTRSFSLKTVAAPVDFQFFPEGGALITGVRSKVAVKAVHPNGLGLEFTARIVDNSGAEVGTFSAQHAGMAAFTMIPEAGKTYTVSANFQDGSTGIYDLPKALNTGLLLSVNSQDTSRMIVRLSSDTAYLKAHLGKTYYLVGKSGNTICYAAQLKLSTAVFSVAVPANKFPAGIAQFTVFEASGMPVSERIFFVRGASKAAVALSSDKPAYTRRQKVKVSLAGKNINPETANFSLSVTDETKVPVEEKTEHTILTSLLLTSDLKGYVENPNHYFINSTSKTAADLDLLMLTQGYRRFSYTEILANKIPQLFFLPEQGIEVTGTLRTATGMPLKGGGLTLQLPDQYFTTSTTTDPEGRFRFSGLTFQDSAKVVVTSRIKAVMLMVDGAAMPGLGKNPAFADEVLNIDTMMTEYLANSRKIQANSRVLATVDLTARATPKSAVSKTASYSSLSGLGSIPDRLISGDRFSGCVNLIGCIQSVVGGVTYETQTQSFYVTRSFIQGSRVPMAIFVNGMNVDVNYLAGVDPNTIESLEGFFTDQLGTVNRLYQTNGVISVNLKVIPKGEKISLADLQSMLPQPNIAKISPKGYNASRVFYAPKYLPGTNTFGPDLRTTIYWNPTVVLDATGKMDLEFYCADSPGTYKAVLEGLDREGNLVRSVYRFRVN